MDVQELPPLQGVDDTPASAAQSRMWVLEEMAQGEGAYNVPMPVRLRGPLDRLALAGALADVVARHEVLRTTLRMAGGRLTQRVNPAAAVPLPVTDVSAADPAARSAAVGAAVARAESVPFDLTTGPVLRAELVRLRPDDHVLVLAVHHVALDAWSFRLLQEDLAAAYTARVTPGTPAPPPAGRYAGRAAELGAGWRAELAAFWSGYLTGAPVLDLPAVRATGPDPDEDAGGFLATTLPAALVDDLRALAGRAGGTLFDVVAAGLGILLARYTGQDDLVLGATAPLRDDPELATVLGPIANTVAVRVNLTGPLRVHDLLDRVALSASAAFRHAALPYEEIVAAVAGDDRQVFRTYLGVTEDNAPLPSFGPVTAEAIVPDFARAKFDVGFGLHLCGAEPVLDCGFDRRLFDDESAARLLAQVQAVLAAMVRDPARPVHELPVLPAGQLSELLVEFNDTARPFPSGHALHELFERQADRQPAAPAVLSGSRRLTYGELERRANAVAHRLRRHGVGRDDVVAVRLSDGLDRAVAVLGTLKAGAGFLPVDPAYPVQRQEFLLRDSGAAVLLTEGAADFAGTVLGVGPEDGDEHTRPAAVAGPDSLAYLIYTSGTTGIPKGIELRHRGAVNNFTDFNDRFAVGAGDVLLSVSSPSFDMSVYDLLGTLAAGATVVVPEPHEAKEPARWSALSRAHGVTVWHSAPALLDLLLEQAGPGDLATLRLALLGGDWIGLDLPARLRAAAGDVRFVALGGATESSMDSTLFEVTEVDPRWRSIPYGRPMANQRVYVLDGHLQPVPVGVPGELFLAGEGLARGYHDRPELTAERFRAVTLPDGRTERMYRTGDLARFGPDGVLELLGRLDLQVKIHGLRVELGEVEAALRAATGVREAIVVARGERGHHTLAAFVQADPGGYDQARVRAELAGRLPAHHVPATLTVVESFPATPNGKVDRKALAAAPSPSPSPSPATATAPAPGAALDGYAERVVAAWRQVLEVPEIGLDDNFFMLGGDSFAAVRAAYALGGALPVVELFKHPTVRELAAVLATTEQTPDAARSLLSWLTPADRRPDATVICVPYGGGNPVAFRPLATALPDRFAVAVVALPGHDPSSVQAEFLPFDEAAERTAEEILAIDGPVLVYGHCAGSWLALDVARRIEEAGADLRGVYLGGTLPNPTPEEALANSETTSDEQWRDYLHSIGGFDGPLDTGHERDILRAGRETHIGAMEFQMRAYADRPRRLIAPLHAVFGDADPTLPGFATDHRDWLWYAETVDVAVVPGGGHYFIGSHADDVAALIDHQNPPEDALAPSGPWRLSTTEIWTIAGRTGIEPVLAGRNGA